MGYVEGSCLPVLYIGRTVPKGSDYHTLHHLTHIAPTRLASHTTARRHYPLLTSHLYISLSTTPPTYCQRFLNARWAFNP
jgi:hypothetical protein